MKIIKWLKKRAYLLIKWLKKWTYLLMVIGFGAVYLACVDGWAVYAEPMALVRSWWADTEGEDGLTGSDNEGHALEAWASETEQGDFTGSGNGPGQPGEPAGSGDTSGQPGEPTGSGNGLGQPGEATGSGNGPGQPGGRMGSGNGPGQPGGSTGSGNGLGQPGGSTGSGNSPGIPGQNEGNGEIGAEVPEYVTVEDDYFADAVFIGDSRTVGMFEYGGLEETAAFYASTGLTVYKMFDSEIVPVPGEKKKITVEEALQQNTFAKIYLMIGINEMGTGTVESFLAKYAEVVAHLRELQPEAILYLQAIMKVTAERSAQGDYINNEGIIARNEGIAALADNEKIFFLDVNPVVCDESGGMIPDYTFDGVHLKAKYIGLWKDYLKTHAIFP